MTMVKGIDDSGAYKPSRREIRAACERLRQARPRREDKAQPVEVREFSMSWLRASLAKAKP